MARKTISADGMLSAAGGTKERILDSAAAVLSKKGFAGARLTDIAEHAGLQAPAIYYYFGSRDDLIEEVIVTGVQRMRAHVSDAVKAASDVRPLERILVAVTAHLELVLVASDFTTAATRNGGQMPDHLRERYEAERQVYGDVWRQLFEDAAAAGEIKPGLDLGSARMLVLGALNWAAEWWDPERGTLADLEATARSVILGGIAADPQPMP